MPSWRIWKVVCETFIIFKLNMRTIDIMNTEKRSLKTSAFQLFLFQISIYDTIKVTTILYCVLYCERPSIRTIFIFFKDMQLFCSWKGNHIQRNIPEKIIARWLRCLMFALSDIFIFNDLCIIKYIWSLYMMSIYLREV